jgi:hypothetical protein
MQGGRETGSGARMQIPEGPAMAHVLPGACNANKDPQHKGGDRAVEEHWHTHSSAFESARYKVPEGPATGLNRPHILESEEGQATFPACPTHSPPIQGHRPSHTDPGQEHEPSQRARKTCRWYVLPEAPGEKARRSQGSRQPHSLHSLHVWGPGQGKHTGQAAGATV